MNPACVSEGVVPELGMPRAPMQPGWTRRYAFNGRVLWIERKGWTKRANEYLIWNGDVAPVVSSGFWFRSWRAVADRVLDILGAPEHEALSTHSPTGEGQ